MNQHTVLRKVTRTVLATAFLGVSVAADVAHTQPAARAKPRDEISMNVSFGQLDCATDGPEMLALAGAKVVLKTKAGPIQEASGVLGEDGSFTATVPGWVPKNAAIKGFAVLDGSRIRVGPDPGGWGPEADDPSAAPYKIPLGALDRNLSNPIAITDLVRAGAANIWTVLNEASSAAERSSPRRDFGKVLALWRYGADLKTFLGDAGGSTAYLDQEKVIYVASKASSDRDEWEAFALAHEYGHHVLEVAAPPTGGRFPDEEDHHISKSYPDHPALPWSEGFANAFGAAVLLGAPELTDLQSPRMGYRCQDFMDLGVKPAAPVPAMTVKDANWYSAYNETRVAGALWHVWQWICKCSDPVQGLGPFLDALATYEAAAGHFPYSLREARDALITGGLEPQSPEGHTEVAEIFLDQQIGWMLGVRFRDRACEQAGNPPGCASRAWDDELLFEISGPSLDCKSSDGLQSVPRPPNGRPWEGEVGGQGGLSHTWHDDCLMEGGDGREPYQGYLGHVQLWFPYTADHSHIDGTYTLTATWLCKDPSAGTGTPPQPDRCPSSNSYLLEVRRRVRMPDEDQSGVYATLKDIALERGKPTTILTFTGLGKCTVVVTGDNCTV